MSTGPAPADRAQALREEFDAAFATSVSLASERLVDLLAIRVGADPYALRLSEVAAVHADKALTPLRGSSAALLGIAGFRGTVVGVYDLQVLLGGAKGASPRWVALAAQDPRIGLAFDAFEGHLRVPPDAIAMGDRPASAADAGHLGGEAVRVGDVVRPVLPVAVMVSELQGMPRRGLGEGARET